LRDTAINLLSLSAHKLHGPKGVGALYVNRQTRFTPFIPGGSQETHPCGGTVLVHRQTRFTPWVAGGSQENGRRGGTENVAGIVGLGKAAELAAKYLAKGNCSVRSMRDRFEKAILESVNGASVNGAAALRIPNTSSLSFEGIESSA